MFLANIEIEDVDECSNLNWTDIVTPIKAERLSSLLTQAGYPREHTQELVQGFRNGFDIGYREPMNRKHKSANLPIRVGSITELWNKVMKEVKAQHYAGPFERPPSNYFIQSPLGLVPKSGNKTRLIFHLSYNFGESDADKSVNFHTPSELCTVHYRDLEHTIKHCLRLIKMTNLDQILFFSKTDCSNAFRLVLILVAK